MSTLYIWETQPVIYKTTTHNDSNKHNGQYLDITDILINVN
jgi:hypothetical protein